MHQDASALPDTDEALSNCARLLREAELEGDLVRRKTVVELADSWLNVASFIYERTL